MSHLTVTTADHGETHAIARPFRAGVAAVIAAWKSARAARRASDLEAAFQAEGGVLTDATERRLEARLFGLR